MPGAYYLTPHGDTPAIPIHRGTLQGDTLSPFLFTIFMEPLLRWISIGSRGYKHKHQHQTPTCTYYMTYDDHGYADDINITTRTLENLQIQIKKLHLFSKYTGLELKTSKGEATGALWGYVNPMSKANTNLLMNEINTIKFENNTNIKYLPPNKSYKMLGVQINSVLDFRDHLKHISTEVRKLARVLTKQQLSPNRKQLMILQLLKSKYIDNTRIVNIWSPHPHVHYRVCSLYGDSLSHTHIVNFSLYRCLFTI